MLKTTCLISLSSAMILLSGCATMVRGTSQQLQITSTPSGARAMLSNGQSCTTPCNLKLKRNQSVVITYKKAGCKPGQLSVYPTLAGAGVILGGLVDYGDGAVYNLTPNPATVMLDCAAPARHHKKHSQKHIKKQSPKPTPYKTSK